ncbi:barstar family protein [Streptomyces sp. NPDC085614]|uniref:barstar family protein n=1 Tax=Streptomyces sp. NPDC085614 TaxID=3365733 RepID=UPI0037D75710
MCWTAARSGRWRTSGGAGETIRCGGYFGRNLDALADCLRGGFGTPDDGDFVIECRDHEASRQHLGRPETARQLDMWPARCHPTNTERMVARSAEARAGRGPSVTSRKRAVWAS